MSRPIEYYISQLLGDQNKRFYANFLMQMKRVITDTIPAPAGVSFTDSVTLYINPELFDKLPEDTKTEVLEHECMHFIKEHVYMLEGLNPAEAKLWNYAWDAEINQYLPRISTHANKALDNWSENYLKGNFCPVTPETLARMFDLVLEREKSSGYYYNMIHKKANEDGMMDKLAELFTNVDDHSGFSKGKGDEAFSKEMKKEIIKGAFDKAIKNSGGIGMIPGHLSSDLNRILQNKIDWRQELRAFYAHVSKSIRGLTKKKRNRRYGLLNPGKKNIPDLHIAACLDTSGSMYDELLVQAGSEIRAMYEAGAKITVIEADADVQDVYEYDPNIPFSPKGRGGTTYGPAIDKALELEVDAILYIGDMDTSDVPNDPGLPFLWVILGSQNPPVEWGRSVRIDKTI